MHDTNREKWTLAPTSISYAFIEERAEDEDFMYRTPNPASSSLMELQKHTDYFDWKPASEKPQKPAYYKEARLMKYIVFYTKSKFENTVRRTTHAA